MALISCLDITTSFSSWLAISLNTWMSTTAVLGWNTWMSSITTVSTWPWRPLLIAFIILPSSKNKLLRFSKMCNEWRCAIKTNISMSNPKSWLWTSDWNSFYIAPLNYFMQSLTGSPWQTLEVVRLFSKSHYISAIG